MENRLSQLSTVNFNNVNEGNENVERNILRENDLQENLVLTDKKIDSKLFPESFDGTGNLNDFLIQFSLVSKALQWDEYKKKVVLISSLKGNARSVLEGIIDLGEFSFSDLESRLKLRFGEAGSSQNFYSIFINRKQRFGENFSVFGFELERLSRLAYPECSFELRDKIACAQFINAISNVFIKRILLSENITSLKLAIERAKVLEVINESCSFKRQNFSRKNVNFEQNRNVNLTNISKENIKHNRVNFFENVVCWQCGKKGHYRSECSKVNQSSGN